MRDIVLMPPNWLGDVILAQPALRALSLAFKSDKLYIVGRPWLVDVVPFLNLEHPQVEYLTTIPKHADKVFLFPNSLSSGIQAFRSRAKERIGFKSEGRGILLTHAYRSRIDMIHEHHRRYFIDLLQQYGIATLFDDVELKTPVGNGNQTPNQTMSLLKEKGINSSKFICVAPGAQFGGAKRYPAEAYAHILSWLSQEGWDVVVLGTAAERDIATACLSKTTGTYWNAAGETSLSQALGLVSETHLMLCNDSGLMHVAAGLGVPTVAMFGATDPQRTSPSGKKVKVLYKPAACSPCLQRECHTLGHPCMGNILPEMVRDACLSFLNE